MALGNPFSPNVLGQTTISVTASSVFTAVPPTTGGLGLFAAGGECMELYNAGPAICFVETCGGGNGIVVATVANSYPIGVGQCKVIATNPGDSGISVIGSVGTTLYCSRGDGN